jgi:hypothetical protein
MAAETRLGRGRSRRQSTDQIHFDLYTTEIGMTGPAAPGAEPGLERIASEIHKTVRGIVGRKEWTQRRSSGPR